MVVLIATEATIFLGLLAAYFFLRASSPTWPQGGIKPPELLQISIFTVDPARLDHPRALGRVGHRTRSRRQTAAGAVRGAG